MGSPGLGSRTEPLERGPCWGGESSQVPQAWLLGCGTGPDLQLHESPAGRHAVDTGPHGTHHGVQDGVTRQLLPPTHRPGCAEGRNACPLGDRASPGSLRAEGSRPDSWQVGLVPGEVALCRVAPKPGLTDGWGCRAVADHDRRPGPTSLKGLVLDSEAAARDEHAPSLLSCTCWGSGDSGCPVLQNQDFREGHVPLLHHLPRQ